MTDETETKNLELPIRDDLIAGIDVGGTKIHIADTASTIVHRYDTTEFNSMYELLDHHFQAIGIRPAKITVCMAGPRDNETGEIKLTNMHWPVFRPIEASEKYSIAFTTASDMTAAMAGVLHETGIDLLQLKPGLPAQTGTKLVVTLSTGIGTAAAVWDSYSQRYVLFAGEGGHIGFQPKNEAEQQYLEYLHTKYPHASAEFALSGKHGIDNLVDHALQTFEAPLLQAAVVRARDENRPVGAVLLEIATQGQGADQQASSIILGHLGAMLGSVLRDLALTYMATGGVYLIGSMALGLGEYLAEHTDFANRFVRQGAVLDSWLEKIPIQLVTDPNVTVVGALALAKGL